MDTVGGCSLRYVVIIMKENIHIEKENILQITHLTVKLILLYFTYLMFIIHLL